MSSRLDSNAFLIAFVLLLPLTLACQPEEASTAEPEVAATPERVENAEVGIAIIDLPEMFVVDLNEGPAFELGMADPQAEGRVVILAGAPESGGINLVAATEQHGEELSQMEDGEWKGQRELMGSALGTVFYSRGQFTLDGARTEETKLFMIHPWQDRQLHVVYRYPAAEDSGQRIQDHLIVLLEQLEALPAAGEEAETEGDASDTSSDTNAEPAQ